MANLLDDVFSWAAQQSADNSTWVNLGMTTNEISENNLVTYMWGQLYYRPAFRWRWFWGPPQFAGGVTQLPSSPTYVYPPPPPGELGGNPFPFDPTQAAGMDVTISPPRLWIGSPPAQYEITVHSSQPEFSFTFNPSFDAATGVIYATIGPMFLVLTLCNRWSVPPPQ